MLRSALTLTTIMTFAAAGTAHASKISEAQDRCLVYGFKKQNNIARCAEIELGFDKPKHWKFSDIDKPQSTCMVLGYRDEKLADCVMRHMRNEGIE